MLLHVQHNVEIARRSTERAGLAASGKPNARAVFYASGNFRVDRALPQNPTFAFALGAGIGNHVARSLAGGTSSRNAEETLLIPHLPAAVASTAGGWAFAGSPTRTGTIPAGLVTSHHHARLGAARCLFELDG